MEDNQRVGLATVRLERVTDRTRIRVMTSPDAAAVEPATSTVFDDPEEALEAIRSFVYGWYCTQP
jgi:hypothetical protein